MSKPAFKSTITPDEGIVQAQFVLGTGWTSRLIAYRSGNFSHVDFVMPAGYGYPPGSLLGARSDVLLGIPPGVRVRPANYEKWANTLVLTKHVPKAQEAAVYNYALSQLGKPYDVQSIMGFITGHYPKTEDWRDPSAFFCDEFLVLALEKGGVIPTLVLTPNRIDPGGASLVLSAAGFV